MTAKEKVLEVWPDTILYGNKILWKWLWYRESDPDKVSGQFDTEEAAWQNAAESLPAQTEQVENTDCTNCGHPRHISVDGTQSCGLCCNEYGLKKRTLDKVCSHYRPTSSEPVAPVEAKGKVCPTAGQVMCQPKGGHWTNSCEYCGALSGTPCMNHAGTKPLKHVHLKRLTTDPRFAKSKPQPDSSSISSADEESRIAIMADRQWIAGARFGYGCGQFDDQKALDLAIEGRQKLIRAEPQPDPAQMGEPAMPMTAGNWTPAEWKSAEARVFAQRVLYKPDALSAIYKDIAINLQAELDRISTEQAWLDIPSGSGYWWHHDGNPDLRPFIYHIQVSLTGSPRYFIDFPDSRWCDEVGGKWMKVIEPIGWNAAKGQSNGR